MNEFKYFISGDRKASIIAYGPVSSDLNQMMNEKDEIIVSFKEHCMEINNLEYPKEELKEFIKVLLNKKNENFDRHFLEVLEFHLSTLI